MHLRLSFRCLGHCGALAALMACRSEAPTTSGRSDSLLRFTVTNDLEAPVTIAVDDTVRLMLVNGSSGGVAVSPSAQWLTWTSAKPTDTTGTPIPDDIGQVQVRVRSLASSVLDITNVIDDTTYVTPQFFNYTSAPVSIGVYEVNQGGTSAVSCAGFLWAASETGPGFTKIGYYRLLPGTEVRAYRGSRCTGPYVSWKSSELVPFKPKSGLVNLTLDTAP